MYLRNQWAGLDVLAGPGIFRRTWPYLCTGNVADAIGRGPKPWHRQDAGAVLATWPRAMPSPRRARHRVSSTED